MADITARRVLTSTARIHTCAGHRGLATAQMDANSTATDLPPAFTEVHGVRINVSLMTSVSAAPSTPRPPDRGHLSPGPQVFRWPPTHSTHATTPTHHQPSRDAGWAQHSPRHRATLTASSTTSPRISATTSSGCRRTSYDHRHRGRHYNGLDGSCSPSSGWTEWNITSSPAFTFHGALAVSDETFANPGKKIFGANRPDARNYLWVAQ